MYTVIWLAVSTLVGLEVCIHFMPDINPLLGAGTGFGVSGILRLLIASGGAGVEAIGEAIGELLGAIFSN